MSDRHVGIAGLGTIGMAVSTALCEGRIPGLRLSAVAASTRERAAAHIAHLPDAPVAVEAEVLPDHADIIIECAPAAAFRACAEPAIEAGRTLIVLSAGALLSHMDLIDRAAVTGARITVPTGALVGLDAVRAMAEGTIHTARIETRKPPAGLAGAPYLTANGIDLKGLKVPQCVFSGTAREAALAFPANINVGAALSLAGAGPDRTEVAIWADPQIARNTHIVTVQSDSAEAAMTITGLPSSDNPKTSASVANSVLATLRRLTSPLVVGS
ncbi:MAG: aspartate dehydrogenase [Pseudomonadota bacterium]